MSADSRIEGMAMAKRAFGRRLLLAVFPAFIGCLVPASAWGDIYAWTDERGLTVFSNVRPGKSVTANNFRVVAEEEKPSPAPAPSREAAGPIQSEAIRRGKALAERIENLERQLQALQHQTQQNQALLNYTQRYIADLNQAQQYQAQLPPPLGYYTGYSPAYYYPPVPVYSYPVVPAFSVVAFPKRFIVKRRPIVTARVLVPTRVAGVSPRVLSVGVVPARATTFRGRR